MHLGRFRVRRDQPPIALSRRSVHEFHRFRNGRRKLGRSGGGLCFGRLSAGARLECVSTAPRGFVVGLAPAQETSKGPCCRLRWAGIVVGLGALCALLSMGEAADVTLRISPTTEGGGAVGYLVYMLFERYLGTGGSLIVLVCVLAISTLLATGITPCSDRVGGGCVFGYFCFVLPFRSIKAVMSMGRSMKPEPENRPAKKRPETPEPQIFEPVRQPPPPPKMKQDSFALRGFQFGLPHAAPDFAGRTSIERGPGRTRKGLQMNARIVEKKLQDFGVQGKNQPGEPRAHRHAV